MAQTNTEQLLETISKELEKQTGTLISVVSNQEEARRDAARTSALAAAGASSSQPSSDGASSAGGKMAGLGGLLGGAGGGLGSILGGVGGLVGGAVSGIGVGGGALLAGVGVLAAGGGYLLGQLNELDGASVRANVKEIVGIKDDFGGVGNFFLEGGTFALTLAGLGAGLGIFAAGGGAAAALDKWDGDGDWTDSVKTNVKNLLSLADEISDDKVSILKDGGTFFATLTGLGLGLGVFGVGGAAAAALSKFEVGDWAGKVKDQVKTLLEIPDLPNAGLGGAVTFIGTMGGLAVGLAAFALGKGAEGIVSVGTEGLEAFTGEPFAERVKSEVKTLLEIPDLPNANLGGVLGFIGVMGGLAVGLAAFAFGKGVEGVTEVGQEGLSFFTNQTGFAERVKAEVGTLLEIPSLPNATLGDVSGFIGVMGGLATGLIAFSAAKGISGAISFFTGENFASGVKTEVDALLSITSGTTDDGSTFNTAMGNIAAGLLKFSAGEFGASLTNIGSSILGFLSGSESPIDKVLSIADNADKLTEGASALGAIADNLNKFQSIVFDGDKFNIKGFANDLKAAVPIIEGAIMGDDGGWFGTPVLGLASAQVDYEAAKKNIQLLRGALGGNTDADRIGQSTTTTRTAGIVPVASLGEGGGGGTAVLAPVNPTTNNYYNTNNNYYTTTSTTGSIDPSAPGQR